jgi:ribosomal protein S27AE
VYKYSYTCLACQETQAYKVSMDKRYKCKKCKNTTFTREPYKEIALDDTIEFPGYFTIYKCNNHSHTEPTKYVYRIDPNRDHHCSRCGQSMFRFSASVTNPAHLEAI